MIAFPIPVPGGAPPWVGALLALIALAGFAVLVLQAVRYFRANRDDDDRNGSGGDDGPTPPAA